MNIFKKKEKKEKKPAVAGDSVEKKGEKPRTEKRASRLVLRPWVSEKSTALKEERGYVFLVRPEAGKTEIGKEIEARYGVSVEGVRIIRKEGKAHRFGKYPGKRPDVKKAIVKLKEGDAIDII
ncbi:MAG: 50S ribosomal protein L23 [Nanoarchaeota archaeon]|nr:50S ribosomal protein L23 [Nanoarchaeota archaeon]